MGQKSRDRVEKMRAQERARADRRRRLVMTGVVLGVLVLVVGIGAAVQLGRSGGTPDAGSAAPAGTVDRYAVPRGDASAPVRLTLYEDFQCPACRATEAYLRTTIAQLVDEGRIRVLYRPIAFLDNASTTDYSSRALGAAACVLEDAGTGAYLRMHDLLYANQPPEGGAGLDDSRLADIAGRAGADRAAVAACMDEGRFEGWVAAATDQASKNGVNATPTILVDGEQLQLTQDEDPKVTLRRAVQAAS